MRQISKQQTKILSENDSLDSEVFLGKGAFADVYKVTQNGKTYAVKKIPKVVITRQMRQKQLMRQIEILRKVNHENIVNFVDFQDDDKKYFIIKMQFCQGTNLRNFLLSEEYANLSEKKVKYYATRICLDYIHALAEVRSKMVTNRDIKPDNIIIQFDGKIGKIKAKMIDFGQATFNINEAMTHVGTNGYMAPEVYFSIGSYSDSCDLWSLGQTIYEIFEGVRPDSLQKQYLGSPFKQNFNPKSPKDYKQYYEQYINEGINLTKSRTPGPFRQIIRGLLSVISEERMSFAQMLEVLEKRFIQIGQCLESEQQITYECERLKQSIIKQKQTQFQKNNIKQNLHKIEEALNLYKKIMQKLPQVGEALKVNYKDISKLVVVLIRQIAKFMNSIVDKMNVQFQCLFQEILVGVINKDQFEDLCRVADKIMAVLGEVGEYTFVAFTPQIKNFIQTQFNPEANNITSLIQKLLKN